MPHGAPPDGSSDEPPAQTGTSVQACRAYGRLFTQPAANKAPPKAGSDESNPYLNPALESHVCSREYGAENS